MPTRFYPYWFMSSPGELPELEIGFTIPEGDSIDPAHVTITANHPGLSGADIEIPAEARIIDGVEYPAGSVVRFTLIAAADIPLFSNKTPYFVYISYETFGDPNPEKLTWKKRVDVYPEGVPLDQ